jgi:hypothetical protein
MKKELPVYCEKCGNPLVWISIERKYDKMCGELLKSIDWLVCQFCVKKYGKRKRERQNETMSLV